MAQRLVDFINRLSLPNRPATLKINKEINRGAWGVVYAGLLDDQPVAVKAIHELLKDAKNGESVIVNFCEECDRLKKVEHPHVISKCAPFCYPGFSWVSMGLRIDVAISAAIRRMPWSVQGHRPWPHSSNGENGRKPAAVFGEAHRQAFPP